MPQAKDGKNFTNKPPMMAHNRALDAQGGGVAEADPLQQPGQDQGMDPGMDQTQQDPTEQVMQDFESVMQAVQSGQAPDPQAAKQLVDYFSQFAQSPEQSQEPDGDEPQYE